MLKIQINLHTVTQNLLKIKKNLPQNTKICAVVKANAYGFGDILIAKHIINEVDCFGVASVAEAQRLRAANIKKDILVFGVCGDVDAAVKSDLIITINSLNELQNAINKKVRFHIAVETGMNRFGVKKYGEFQKMIEILATNNSNLAEGLYTHFAFEVNNIARVKKQAEKFNKFIRLFKKHFPFGTIHGASSGTINYPPAAYDMARVGKALYGGIDGTDTAITVESKIIAVKRLKAGESVSYNGEWSAKGSTTIGIVAGGYADGINMRFSGHSFALIDGNFCQIVGRVCMDCFAVVLPRGKDYGESAIGKTVSVISNRNGQTLMDIYKKTNIIVCDILCGIKHARAEVTVVDCDAKL
jgi:alanine racemase